MVAEQGLYIKQTNVYFHVSHIRPPTLVPGNNNRKSQDQVEEKG